MSNLIVKREFTTRRVAKSEPVTISASFDWSGVPNTSLYVLATRALIIDMQRRLRSTHDNDDDFKQALMEMNGKTVKVLDYLKKNPAKQRQRKSAASKFVREALNIGLTPEQIRDLMIQKNFSPDEIEQALEQNKK